jgi:D-arabinose 1-dehydrogenase-like Zn-dependent alcohol dehydrogenase
MLNRRSFIIATGLTALASTRVLGANDTVRIGVIGAGGRMRNLLDAADKVGPYQIVAVSDVYAPHRDTVKERSNGVATTHLDYREVLAQDIDAVFIASPDHWHVRMAVDALAAGKALRSSARFVPASRFCSAACSSAAGPTFAMPST